MNVISVLANIHKLPAFSDETTLDKRSGKWQSKNTNIFVGTII